MVPCFKYYGSTLYFTSIFFIKGLARCYPGFYCLERIQCISFHCNWWRPIQGDRFFPHHINTSHGPAVSSVVFNIGLTVLSFCFSFWFPKNELFWIIVTSFYHISLVFSHSFKTLIYCMYAGEFILTKIKNSVKGPVHGKSVKIVSYRVRQMQLVYNLLHFHFHQNRPPKSLFCGMQTVLAAISRIKK